MDIVSKIPVCNILSDGSGVEIWFEREGDSPLKLKIPKKAAASLASMVGLATAHLGETIPLSVVMADVQADESAGQMTIALGLQGGNVLPLMFTEHLAINLARRIVEESRTLRRDDEEMH